MPCQDWNYCISLKFSTSRIFGVHLDKLLGIVRVFIYFFCQATEICIFEFWWTRTALQCGQMCLTWMLKMLVYSRTETISQSLFFHDSIKWKTLDGYSSSNLRICYNIFGFWKVSTQNKQFKDVTLGFDGLWEIMIFGHLIDLTMYWLILKHNQQNNS